MGAGEFGDRGGSGVAHLRRPGVPRERPARLGEMLVQRFEGGKGGERLAALPPECAESGAERTAAAALPRPEAAVERLQHRALQRRDGGVFDQPGAAGRQDRVGRRQRLRGGILGKTGDPGHVDVEIIEPYPARWRIRAEVARLGGEQRMERVDPDHAGAELTGLPGEGCQIAEIADAPIARAAQPVKLGGEAPAARPGLQRIAEMACIGCDGEADFRTRAAAGDGEAVIAERQSAREAQLRPVAPPGAFAAVLEPAVPFDAAAFCREAQCQRRSGILLRHDMDRREPEWCRPAFLGQHLGGLGRVRRQAERGNQPGQRLFIGLVHHAKRVDMTGGDADRTGDMAQLVEPAHRRSPSGMASSGSAKGWPSGARLMNSAKECARNW